MALLALLPIGTIPDRETHARGNSDAAACGRCHTEHHAEWKRSAHARAFTDPIYQRALVGKPRPELCHGCHVPGEVQRRLGHRPEPRTHHRDDGVDCAACHVSGETVRGPLGTPTEAHRGEKDPTFTAEGATALCASCHATKIGPVLPLARDFQASGLAATGKSCVGCHMTKVARPLANDPVTSRPSGPIRDARSHAILGPDDTEFCASAFALGVKRQGDEIVATVTNNAGHRVPGLTLRKFAVRIRQLDGSGRELRKEPGTEITAENDLRCAETRELRFLAVPGMSIIEVTIEHHAFDKLVATILQKTWRP